MDGDSLHFHGGNAREQGRFSRFVYQHSGARPRSTAELPDTHAAVREGRTLFPTRVFNASHGPHVLVPGVNNAKIGSVVTKGPWTGFPIYTLTLEERATCPASCDLWAACYGNSMPLAKRRDYTPALIRLLDAELREMGRKHRRGFVVRLHVLGDFPDLAYVAHWSRWMAEIPALHVFGYTAHPAHSPIGQTIAAANAAMPDRWAIRFSVPPGTTIAPMQATTIWRAPGGANVPEGLICPSAAGTTETCGTCALCWAPAAATKRIVFVGHGLNRGAAAGRRRGPYSPAQMPVTTKTAQSPEAPDMVPAPQVTINVRIEASITGGTPALTDLLLRVMAAFEGEGATIAMPPPGPPAVPQAMERPVIEDSPAKAPEPQQPAVKQKRAVTPEHAEQLRANLAKAREEKAAKRAAAEDAAPAPPAPSRETCTPPADLHQAPPTATPLATLGHAPQPARTQPAPPPRPVAPPQPPISRMEALVRASKAAERFVTREAFAPILVDLDQVQVWAAPRGIQFASWDDLPRVNRKREQMALAPFARRFPVKGVRRA